MVDDNSKVETPVVGIMENSSKTHKLIMVVTYYAQIKTKHTSM